MTGFSELLLAGSLLLTGSVRQPASTDYVLHRQELGGNNGCLLRLYNRATHKFVWQQIVTDAYRDPIWSDDHRIMALLVNRSVEINTKLLIWKVGQPPRLLPAGNEASGYLFQDWDGILNMWWSPDKKRLLLRAYYSGGGDSNSGQLLCYVLDKKRFYEGPKSVRRAEWAGAQQVRYWRVLYHRPWIKDVREKSDFYTVPPEDKHARTWRCP